VGNQTGDPAPAGDRALTCGTGRRSRRIARLPSRQTEAADKRVVVPMPWPETGIQILVFFAVAVYIFRIIAKVLAN
jgi:hypothetical protein